MDSEFVVRADAVRAKNVGGIIVAGDNYGQGSSREHAALAPRHLGICAVVVRSLARIHRANLVNFGILPLLFEDRADYDKVMQGGRVTIPAAELVAGGIISLDVEGVGAVQVRNDLTESELDIIRAGGLLNPGSPDSILWGVLAIGKSLFFHYTVRPFYFYNDTITHYLN